MDLTSYVKDAIRTESVIDKVEANPHMLSAAASIFIAAGTLLDLIKKNVFYGKEINTGIAASEIQAIIEALDVIRINGLNFDDKVSFEVDPRIFHSVIGIATEATELVQSLDPSKPDVDRINFLEELGDLNWYEAIGIDATGGDFEKVLETNIAKLRARYPDKFSAENANVRDLAQEQEILTQNVQ